MRANFLFFGFMVIGAWLLSAAAQSEDALKLLLDNALSQYLNAVKPPAGVDGNENTYTYQKAVKINDIKSVIAPDGGKTLRVEATAKTLYKSLHSSGIAIVPVRAVFTPSGDTWMVKKLEWKNGDTMRFTSLLP